MGKNINNQFKSGFVAIIGAPNAGKSTFLNYVLGEKISITSKKPQTTRNRVLGVLHKQKSQIIFIDTPGVHKAKGMLNVKMVESAISAIGDVDLILFMVDASGNDQKSEKLIVEKLQKQNKPVLLALNKIDLIKKHILLSIIDKWQTLYNFKSIIPISAKHGNQIEELLEEMESLLPQGPAFFSDDTLTDMSEKFIVSEIIREKAFRLTGQEIPYSIAITIEKFQFKNKLLSIYATIHVERDSQKGIIIGKQGQMLKHIGQEARKDIERLLGQDKIFLQLFVRVQKNWSSDTKALRKFGY